jgi:hypothetical protein
MASCQTSQTYVQEPSISGGEDTKPAINAAVVVVSFTATGQRGALVLQMAQALPVLAIDNTRAPDGPEACEEGAQSVSQYMKSGSRIVSVLLRTNATPAGAVE